MFVSIFYSLNTINYKQKLTIIKQNTLDSQHVDMQINNQHTHNQ